jgi:hypothetical protein
MRLARDELEPRSGQYLKRVTHGRYEKVGPATIWR